MFRVLIYVYKKYCENQNLDIYITLERKKELDNIVSNILNSLGHLNINIANA